MGNDYFCHKEEYQEKLDKQNYRNYEKEKHPDGSTDDGRCKPNVVHSDWAGKEKFHYYGKGF